MIDRVIDIEKLEFGEELTAEADFWLDESAADETVLADWLAALVSAEDGDDFEQSSELLRVLSSAAVWGEAAAEVIADGVVNETDVVDEYQADLPVKNWSGIASEEAAPILAKSLDGDFGAELWEIGGVMNYAADDADVAANDVSGLAASETAGPAEEILAEFGPNFVADDAKDDRNVGSAADGLTAGGETVIIAGEVVGRIDDGAGADLGEDGPAIWPPIDLTEAAGGIERRVDDYGDFERKTGLAEAWRNGEAAEERCYLADLAARLAGPVADLVAARLNAELQIMLHSR